MRRALAIVAIVACVLASRARADEAAPPIDQPAPCAEGRVRTGEGLCCWPGQAFSPSDHACTGAPRCPEGLVEHGETCVAPAVARPSAPPSSTSSSSGAQRLIGPGSLADAPPTAARLAAPVSAWPPTHEGAPSRPVRRHGEDGGLVAAAMIVFDVGWVMGLLVGIFDELSHACHIPSRTGPSTITSCNSWPLTLIPIGGGITAGLTSFGTGSRSTVAPGLILGIPSVLLQGAGMIMMIAALANEVHDIGFVPIGDQGATLSILPAAQGADVGASAVLAF